MSTRQFRSHPQHPPPFSLGLREEEAAILGSEKWLWWGLMAMEKVGFLGFGERMKEIWRGEAVGAILHKMRELGFGFDGKDLGKDKKER